MQNNGFSVLITVYNKENPYYFEEALSSILNQTLMPSEIVVVKDGRLTPKLDEILEKFMQNHPRLFSVLAFNDNIGRGEALRKGVEHTRFKIVAIMDSDDISKDFRFEKQLRYLNENVDVDIVGSFIEEFDYNENEVKAIRMVPVAHKDIIKFAKWRMPVNHVTTMFKKDSIIKAGNYENLFGFEDYYLMIRAIQSGCKLGNIPVCLVKVRTGNDMLKRRGGLKYLTNEIKAQKKFLACGFINYGEFLCNISAKSLIRLIPNFIRKNIYRFFLRNKQKVENK